MADKIQLIKEEIERLLKENKHNQHNDSIEESLDKASKCRFLYELKKFIDSLPEEPANEDLEEEYDNYFKKHEIDIVLNPYSNCKEIARHFAEWQKQKMMKDAVDATILDVDAQTIEFGLWPEKLLDIKEGNKVKILIIKEN